MSGVSRVTYENGTVVYVNYNESDVACDGLTITGQGLQRSAWLVAEAI